MAIGGYGKAVSNWNIEEKASSISNIPLLPVPLAILKKYENNPICIKNNKCLPVL